MNNNEIEIKIIKRIKREKIIKLYKDAGWWDKDDENNKNLIKKIVKGSYVFVGAFINNELIGMGRVLSDGVSDAYIQDVIVLKEYRNRGIGSKIINFLISFLMNKNIRWIGLISEPAAENFYSKLGFKKMEKYIPYRYYI